ncbi:MAG TPA: DUF3108 domain-containing protein [Terriglobales bacterium]|nr:DUF3108 domain-containing protein [Terriglobales bacterium]
MLVTLRQPGLFAIAILVAAAGFAASDQSHTPSIGPAPEMRPPSAGYRFPVDKTYVYSVEWHLFNAGFARLSMQPGNAQHRVTAIADSVGMVNLLYSIHDRYEGYFDPHTFCSQRIVKHQEEGKRRRDTEITFDYRQRKSILNDKNLKTGETKRFENDIPPCVTDVVTGFYYLASQPLQMGNSYDFPVNDGGKTTEVQAKVESRDQVKVPAGNYQTIRVSAEPVAGPLKGKGKVSVWFTDDASHTPVQMRAKLGWGTLVFRLQRVETK